MAALRKASAYSKKKVRPYTRKAKSRKKGYIKTIPNMKIVKFHMGNTKAQRSGKHEYSVRLISEGKVLLRDNALEACRTLINKSMDKAAQGQYSFAIKVYPHHILRENRTAAGAGADRLSSGMKHSFGVTIGRAAIIQPGKEIFYVSCENEKVARIARDALKKVKSKVPCGTKILFEKVSK
jgi:large subunit ribosomal protein L10e